ncbi:MAG: outer membrane lipoprotein carrier protein LolA [Acidobacteria bacterium]|nr:outer membrane lipoprotein carrier protein LolA [Acidobacteriota bacterium]
MRHSLSQFLSLLTVALTSFASTESASAQSLTLDRILGEMDRAGSRLQSMSAAITQKKWTDILEEFDQGEKGRLSFLKTKDGVSIRKHMVEPFENVLVIDRGNVLFYQPRIKQAQRYKLGSNRDKAEFLLLGFGSDKKALQDAYKIVLLKKEDVRGRETYALELTPKSNQVSAFFSRITIWVDSKLWLPIRQQLTEPNQDYLLIDFEDIRINDPISPSLFQLKIPKDVKIVGS